MAFEAEIHFLPLLCATLLQKAKTSSADGLLLIAARLQHPGEAGVASSEGISKGIVASCRAQHKRAPAPFVREKKKTQLVEGAQGGREEQRWPGSAGARCRGAARTRRQEMPCPCLAARSPGDGSGNTWNNRSVKASVRLSESVPCLKASGFVLRNRGGHEKFAGAAPALAAGLSSASSPHTSPEPWVRCPGAGHQEALRLSGTRLPAQEDTESLC